MILGFLTDAVTYIKNGLPKVTLGEIVFVLTAFTVLSKWIESFFGKKFIGTWIWEGIKKVVLTPKKILDGQAIIMKEITAVKAEVTYNGGSIKLRDAVAAVKATCDNTSTTVQDINMTLKASDEIDNMMKFRYDSVGYLISANRAFLDYFGFKETDVRGFNYESTIEKRDLQDVQVTLQRAITTKADFNCTYGIIDSEGVAHKSIVRGIPLLNKGELHGFYGTVNIKK